jgi:hypothetical protein
VKRLLLATACAGCLLASPAHALSWQDSLTETWDDAPEWVLQLVAVMRQYVSFGNSYLNPIGMDLDEFFPIDPILESVEDAAQQVDRRIEDARDRAGEVMGVSREVAWQQPFNQAKATTLQAANVSPASLFAAIQIGTEVGLENVMANNKTNSLLAEQNQLLADTVMQKDFEQTASKAWTESHYPNGMDEGVTQVVGDTIDVTWRR